MHLTEQLHSELLRTTIMKDFVDYEGISKYARLVSNRKEYAELGILCRFGNVTNGSA
jgi:hypothetical protein